MCFTEFGVSAGAFLVRNRSEEVDLLLLEIAPVLLIHENQVEEIPATQRAREANARRSATRSIGGGRRERGGSAWVGRALT